MRMLTFVLATILLLSVFSSEVVAFSTIAGSWRDTYDTACQELLDAAALCGFCHPGNDTSLLIPYATDLRTANDDQGFLLWSQAMAFIEGDDSDGDGVDNITEILTDCTDPGDPLSVPIGEHTWSQIKALFH